METPAVFLNFLEPKNGFSGSLIYMQNLRHFLDNCYLETMLYLSRIRHVMKKAKIIFRFALGWVQNDNLWDYRAFVGEACHQASRS
jgi:hypothetical protein